MLPHLIFDNFLILDVTSKSKPLLIQFKIIKVLFQTNEVATDYDAGFQTALAALNSMFQ